MPHNKKHSSNCTLRTVPSQENKLVMNWTSWFSQNDPKHVMNKCCSITHKLFWGGGYVIRTPPRTTTCSCLEHQTYNRSESVQCHVDRKRSRREGEDKKRETSPKPLNTNAQSAWRCGDPIIRASRPRRNEIRRAKGMVRRIKENQHWAGVCAGTAMALVYIEPITDTITANNKEAAPQGITQGSPKHAGHDALTGGPGGPVCVGGSQSQGNQDEDQQRKKERDIPLSEEHKNKRRKLKQLELGHMRWGSPDKDG